MTKKEFNISMPAPAGKAQPERPKPKPVIQDIDPTDPNCFTLQREEVDEESTILTETNLSK